MSVSAVSVRGPIYWIRFPDFLLYSQKLRKKNLINFMYIMQFVLRELTTKY